MESILTILILMPALIGSIIFMIGSLSMTANEFEKNYNEKKSFTSAGFTLGLIDLILSFGFFRLMYQAFFQRCKYRKESNMIIGGMFLTVFPFMFLFLKQAWTH